MRIFTSIILGTVLAVGTPVARAAPLDVMGNWDIVNRTGRAANDFHIQAFSDSNLTFVSSVNGAFGSFAHGRSIFNPLVKTYDWSGGTVAAGGMTHIGLHLTQEEANSINIQTACWTDNGVRLNPCVPLAGFTVRPAAGPAGADVRLEVPGADPVFIADFSFMVSPTPVPLPDLNFGLPGFTSVPDFTIDSFFDVFVDLNVAPGSFLIMQGRAFSDPDRQDLLYSFAVQHEHGVPEPGSLALLLTGLAALALGRPRHRRRAGCDQRISARTCAAVEAASASRS